MLTGGKREIRLGLLSKYAFPPAVFITAIYSPIRVVAELVENMLYGNITKHAILEHLYNY